MMKSFGLFLFCVLLMGTWTTAVNTMGYDDKRRNIAASNPGFVSLQTDNNIHDISASMITSRKLKDKIDDISSSNYKEDKSGKINVEDYQPVNPVPSYKASIRPGPVQHGTPLMPYIPNPNSPPPNHGG